jgi:hypothetical protein
LKLFLLIEGKRGLRRSGFYIRDLDFQHNADFAVSIAAYERIRREGDWKQGNGYRKGNLE